MRVEDKYKYTVIQDSLINKDWVAGSKKPTEHTEYLFDAPTGKMIKAKRVYPPSLYKLIDETIVNVLDHGMRCIDDPSHGYVTKLDISIDSKGAVKIRNDGPGIESDWHSEAKMWTPQFVFGSPFQGSNQFKSEDDIIGGTNGIGSKVANCFSTEFIVETVHGNKYYMQKWTNNMKNVEDPTMLDLPDAKLPKHRQEQHTTLLFKPDYVGIYGYKDVNEILPLYTQILHTRAIMAGIYAEFMVNVARKHNSKIPHIAVTFNGANTGIRTPAQLAATMFGDDVQTFTIRAGTNHIWELCVAVTPCSAKANHLCNVNGIIANSGTHVKYVNKNILFPKINEILMKAMGDKTTKLKKEVITKNLFVICNMQIPDPGWGGQRKDVVTKLEKHYAVYEPDPRVIARIGEAIKDIVLDKLMKKPTPKKEKLIGLADKYRPAHYAGTSKSSKCALIAVEGDSAMSQVIAGVTSNKSLGYDYHGIISLGGVIINARKECTIIKTNKNEHLKMSPKFDKNIFVNTFMRVVGLDMKSKYDPASSTYQTEMKKLRYGCIIACVDQDLDGVGNIFGLILNLFETIWPNLLKSGFVKRFATPIIRAFPSRKGTNVVDFYTQVEYDKWLTTNDVTKYEVKYYKGLGTHSRPETVNMFSKFYDHLYVYKVGPEAHDTFVTYFGKEPKLRKIELATPVKPLPPNLVLAQERTKTILCEDHLNYETKMYQLDNIERKLAHVMDGHNQSSRKIYDGVLKAFAKSNKQMKVAQLAGYIAEHENYHHGEASLAQSITGRGFTAVGGEQLPFLVPRSNFGSRNKGGADAASARYIFATFNKRVWSIVNPPEEYQLLEFNFDEGSRSEPKYFVPIIPTVLLQSTHLPGTGWALKLWGRDIGHIIRNVRRLINAGEDANLFMMAPNTYGHNGEIIHIGGKPYSYGCYEIVNDMTIRITELPLRVWTIPYVTELETRLFRDYDLVVDSIVNRSSDINVDIVINLKPGGLSIIQDVEGPDRYCDSIEEMLMLRESMSSNINLINIDGSVLECDDYNDVFKIWFPIRREYYARRIAQKRVELEIKIEVTSHVLRYAADEELFKERPAKKMKIAEIEELLTSNNYVKINKARYNDHKFVRAEDLRALIFECPNASFNYLIDDVTDRMRSSEGQAKLKLQLKSLEHELEELNLMASLGNFPGAEMWLRELESLEKVIEEGRRTSWLFEEHGKHTYM
jgi:DNA gyrase/topoisomerase IV subunit B